MSAPDFELVCEIEPPTRPDLRRVRHQIGVMAPIADAFLIPDNHIGRATVSSIAVAHEVAAMGGRRSGSGWPPGCDGCPPGNGPRTSCSPR